MDKIIQLNTWTVYQNQCSVEMVNNFDISEDSFSSPQALTPSQLNYTQTELAYNLDDIRTIYHPSSRRKPRVDSFELYGLDEDSIQPGEQKTKTPRQAELNHEPWKPFHSRTEFELAELTLEAALSRSQLDRLLRIIRTLVEECPPFKLKTHKDVERLWDELAGKLTSVRILFLSHAIYYVLLNQWVVCYLIHLHIAFKFEHSIIQEDFPGLTKEQTTFDFQYRPLWGWLEDLVTDSELIKEFHWDAENLSKFNGKEFSRFVHEPWTGDRWWEVQVCVDLV